MGAKHLFFWDWCCRVHRLPICSPSRAVQVCPMPQAEGAHIIFPYDLSLSSGGLVPKHAVPVGWGCNSRTQRTGILPLFCSPELLVTLSLFPFLVGGIAFFNSGMDDPQPAGSAAAMFTASFNCCSSNFLNGCALDLIVSIHGLLLPVLSWHPPHPPLVGGSLWMLRPYSDWSGSVPYLH